MVERRPWVTLLSHTVLIAGVLVVAFPLYLTFVASTQTAQDIVQAPMPLLPGSHLLENYSAAWNGTGGGSGSKAPVGHMMLVSLISALMIAIGKITISSLMLPVEVRISPTYKVVSDLGMLNSYAGLTIPLIASATATFLFRQFFLTVPEELVEAARIDGAGPMRFFKDILLPLSKTSIAALFVIQFIYGWNQYLWPLLVTTNENMYPVVIGIKRMISAGDSEMQWNVVMATAVLAMLPPALVVMLMQKWFVKGLVDTEK